MAGGAPLSRGKGDVPERHQKQYDRQDPLTKKQLASGQTSLHKQPEGNAYRKEEVNDG
jgi:hypothetical protein